MPSVTVTPASFTNIVPIAGGTAWTNPTNAGASDGSYATASITNAQTQYLVGYDLTAAAIPSNAIITGLRLDFEVKCSSAAAVYAIAVYLVKDGAVVGDNKIGSEAAWPTTDTTKSYGGRTDTCYGVNLTAAYVSAADFGFAIAVARIGTAVTVSVDHMQATIWYSQGAPLRRRRRGFVGWGRQR